MQSWKRDESVTPVLGRSMFFFFVVVVVVTTSLKNRRISLYVHVLLKHGKKKKMLFPKIHMNSFSSCKNNPEEHSGALVEII